MFIKRSHSNTESFSKYRAGKSSSRSKRSFKDPSSLSTSRRSESARHSDSSPIPDNLNSAIITICVGPDQRLFAAHEDVLCVSPYFSACCRGQFYESHTKRINLPNEQPEILSSILEYLYKGDYYPRLMHNKRRDTWLLEDTDTTGSRPSAESTIINQADGTLILKDTAIYCAAERYGLDELKRLALRKQGLQTAIQCSTILSSARYAYANTPDSDSKLRAHYFALIIRSRSTFKRSGTMQLEMEEGGKLFFDLFVAMCNHMDDLTNASKSPFSR
ncbi:BTB domain-containing protein [Trichophyton interdigitale]|uniref:BTB domain-containing protein n=1 Tax=Trichophyton interdigitale TaxID=101480 RepID=A0A9P4YIS0_9EURO|nr:BTB domain-containing protein [Trichophyton interdigitale]KAF3896702.1 BTB domain-containing protein [Trichophyton interdigitale]KAG8209448.1 BTB domain-containing protein [Trichophyton interdigitale]